MSAAVVLPLIFIWRFELWSLGIKHVIFVLKKRKHSLHVQQSNRVKEKDYGRMSTPHTGILWRHIAVTWLRETQ